MRLWPGETAGQGAPPITFGALHSLLDHPEALRAIKIASLPATD